MPIRNPFARRPGGPAVNDENQPPTSEASADAAHPGFERVDTVGSKASSALSIRSGKSQDTGEYKMSVVNDSGVYLPPSPTERDASFSRRYLSRNSTDTRSSIGDIEHFSISRESFDSYRRSFDITARSPIISHDPAPRQSLDSARFPRLPRGTRNDRRFEREPPTAEEGFEDVGLNDGTDSRHHQQHPKKRSFFKFGSEHPPASPATDGTAPDSAGGAAPAGGSSGSSQMTMMSRFLPGRKRGQSGQGAELGSIERPMTSGSGVASVTETEVQS